MFVFFKKKMIYEIDSTIETINKLASFSQWDRSKRVMDRFR